MSGPASADLPDRGAPTAAVRPPSRRGGRDGREPSAARCRRDCDSAGAGGPSRSVAGPVTRTWRCGSPSPAACSGARPAGSARSTACRFDVARGETLGLVGESGSGKTTTGRAIVRVNDPSRGSDPPRRRGPAGAQGHELRRRRRQFQMVFQDPYSSLDPRQTVGEIIGEPLAHPRPARGRRPRRRIGELLELVGPRPDLRRPLPPRVQRRPAPAHRHRTGTRGRARAHRVRRADLAPSTCRSRRRSSTCSSGSRRSSA